jgi:hypothetical protein
MKEMVLRDHSLALYDTVFHIFWAPVGKAMLIKVRIVDLVLLQIRSVKSLYISCMVYRFTRRVSLVCFMSLLHGLPPIHWRAPIIQQWHTQLTPKSVLLLVNVIFRKTIVRRTSQARGESAIDNVALVKSSLVEVLFGPKAGGSLVLSLFIQFKLLVVNLWIRTEKL